MTFVAVLPVRCADLKPMPRDSKPSLFPRPCKCNPLFYIRVCWLVEGLKRLLETEKFTESDIVKQTLETYKQESDSVACFVAENSYKPSTTEYISLKNLYADYRTFCVEDGASALKSLNFRKRLEANGFTVERFTAGNRVYLETDYA